MRRINLSAAIIVLVCFFLPWVQMSCAGAKATSSGLNLARHDDALLWLIPDPRIERELEKREE